ncbi:pimeloyl-ACP methyl ester carboxylesterase [Dongia mobilis]|uniref:Pimeloyl-ACP methyl ester carboxylesterase n=2 Tax=Dongia mobilis TaxID=578943 RepID=A0A4R6WV19_9PROT|nr:pimeloyl-ACP methyl ester carboxylesterase [Dongia mobilis]
MFWALMAFAAFAVLVGLVVLGWIAYCGIFIPRQMPLPPALSGKREELDTPAGRVSYYRAGPPAGRPLLLIHSVNAAGSAYEVLPLFDQYGGRRPVYALELPGFGFSARDNRPYTPRLMTDAIIAMAREITRLHGGPDGTVPVDALALSLSSEFLARAAMEQPDLFRSVAFVSPTGFNRSTPEQAPAGSTRAMPGLRRALTLPIWRRALFAALTSRPSIRFFLEKTWGGKSIDEGMVTYDYATAHQPGAEHAPYCFVSGYLFSRDIRAIYRALSCPVWMLHGTRGDFVDYSGAPAFKDRPGWEIHILETGALPHFERLEVFAHAYDAFCSKLDAPGGSRIASGPEAALRPHG